MLSAQIQIIRYYARVLIARVENSDRGMTTETVIITAILAGAALLVATAILTYVTRKKDEIPAQGG